MLLCGGRGEVRGESVVLGEAESRGAADTITPFEVVNS